MNDAKSIIKNRVGSSIIQDSLAIIPFISNKIKTRAQALTIAKELRDEINNKYFSDKFGAIAFVDKNREEGVVIDLTVPSKLLDAFEVKFGQRELSQIGKQQTLDLQEKTVEPKQETKEISAKSEDIEKYKAIMNMTQDEVEQLKENCE